MPDTRTRRRPLDHDPTVIRDLRLEAGLLQSQLAERAGCTQGQISELESGAHGAHPPRLKAIADALAGALNRPVTVIDLRATRP